MAGNGNRLRHVDLLARTNDEFYFARILEPVTSESARIGSLGPALFLVIFIGIIVIILCGVSNFIDNPGPRRGLQISAFCLVVLPVLFFSTVTYVSDSSQIVSNRQVDETFKPRIYIMIFLVIVLVCSIASLCAGDQSPLLMHRQGRNVYSGKRP